MTFTKVGSQAMTALGLGAFLSFALPIAAAVILKIRKKEPFSTILIGAATFLLFALILEKPIQNLLLFPTQMGLKDHAVSSYFNARPVLLALMAGLFPGVFEESGRLVAFKTVLKKRKNRETSISHGLGHGCFEALLTVGIPYIMYIVYAMMINAGTFGTAVDQVAAQAPDQAEAMYTLADQIAAFTFTDIGLGFAERLFSVLFHIGASILVFYACRDKKKSWLYPLAVLLHTATDFISALYLFGIVPMSVWALEAVIAVFGVLIFSGAYFLLYRKDAEGQPSKRLDTRGL